MQTARDKIVIVELDDKNFSDEEYEHINRIIKNKSFVSDGYYIFALENIDTFTEKTGISDDDVLILREKDFDPFLGRSNQLINIVTGFTNHDNNKVRLEFGDQFTKSVNYFDNEIQKYQESKFVENKLKYFPKQNSYFIKNYYKVTETREGSVKQASDVHSGMKGFIFVFSVKSGNRNVIFEDMNDHSADVTVDGIFYEAETLYDKGDVLSVLTKKMSVKYSETSAEIIFTMRNVDIIRNYYYLRTFLMKSNNPRIKICGFDIKHEKLISFGEIINKLH